MIIKVFTLKLNIYVIKLYFVKYYIRVINISKVYQQLMKKKNVLFLAERPLYKSKSKMP